MLTDTNAFEQSLAHTPAPRLQQLPLSSVLTMGRCGVIASMRQEGAGAQRRAWPCPGSHSRDPRPCSASCTARPL